METLLDIQNLEVTFRLRDGTFTALNGINLHLSPRRTLGLVGESGCGKSMTARAILRLLPKRASITAGQILLRSSAEKAIDIARLPAGSRSLRQVRGGQIGMIFQEPMASFSPVHTIGQQAIEAVRLHLGLDRAAAREHVIDILRLVGMPSPQTRIDSYPHQLSGGLRQRAMIATALSCRPRLLIADEPTTALDVTVQAQILALLRRLQKQLAMSVLMITHDLGVIAQMADDVAVMYSGRIVEHASVDALFKQPKHPYTRGLLRSVTRLGSGNQHRLESIPGTVPGPMSRPAGCPFHPRCPDKIAGVCDRGAAPALTSLTINHCVACHLYNSDAPAQMAAQAAMEVVS
jgi:oligopeptide/dipeptide ABC transporter ATP-binding protein